MEKVYSCDICGCNFNRMYNLKRHHRTKHWKEERVLAVCDVCGKFFSRLDNMRAHQKIHDQRPIQRGEHGDDKNGEGGPGPSRQTRKRQGVGDDADEEGTHPPQKLGSSGLELPDEIVAELEPNLLDIYRANWSNIKSSVKGGKVLAKYNCYLPRLDTTNLESCAEEIFSKQTTAFKINAAFGFILLNSETNEQRYYYSSGNTRLFEIPFLIKDRATFESFLKSLKEIDPLEYAKMQRPNSKWIVDAVSNVTFFVYKLRDHPIGTCSFLPPYVLENKNIVSLMKNPNTQKSYTDNLCLFRCIALHKGHHRMGLENATLDLFKMYSTQPHANFEGVKLGELHHIEDLFKINIMVYELVERDGESEEVRDADAAESDERIDGEETVARLVRRSLEKHGTTLYVNMYEDHFSFIRNIDRYTHSFVCRKCLKLWKTATQLHRHEASCECKGTTDTFPGGVFVNSPSVFDKIREEGIQIPNEWDYFPHFAVFDFESYSEMTTEKSGGDKLTWTREHIPLSVSVCSNVPSYQEPVCFVSGGEPGEIVGDMVRYLVEIGQESYRTLTEQFDRVISELREKIQKLEGEDESKKQRSYLEKLLHSLTSHLKQIPVFGFNSGSYDINLVKRYLLPYLIENEPIKHLVKRNNNYMSIDTEHLRFLDITNFLAPGFSYDQFLRAYDCSMHKGTFPYEWMHFNKLDHPSLPPREAFDSTLKGTSLTEEDYAHCQDVWQRESMSTMRDYLMWYNNLDVKPFVEAVEKMAETYRKRNIDLFKDGISVPGLTLKYLFDISPSANFALFGNQDQDLYKTFRKNLVGGPSIVFTRYHEAGDTRIRGGKLCEKIQGYDANALYLWALRQDMPTGYPTRRKEETSFKKERKPFSIKAQDWLDWEAQKRGIKIRHEGNDSEKRLGPRMLPVDGWCSDTKQTFEFQGCYFHGHACEKNPRHAEDVMRQRHAKTIEKKRYLEELGFEFIEMWECQFDDMKKTDPKLRQFLQERAKPLDYISKLSVDEIMHEILKGRFFGCIECDIHVPDHMKPYFAEMTPIFKNTNISRDDIGSYMKTYGEEHNIMNTPRRSLIGSMSGEKIFLATPLAKWYLEHGLVITRVYQVVEYKPSPCFAEFADAVSDARRAGDSDPSKSVIADTMKLMGNSSYGKTITNKTRFRTNKITDSSKASRLINEILFRDLNTITDDCHEVEMAKSKIAHDLPIQIGFFVYQYAKLRMLQFYFDFLDVFLDRSDFEYVQMDTDSAYLALSGSSIESLVRPELRQRFEVEKHHWLPRTDTEEHRRYDKRTPGLFKLEWEGQGIVALCSKTWYGCGSKDKFSCKGANKRNNNITFEKYKRVLQERTSDSAINRGFRVKDNHVLTYKQERSAFTFFYPKRKVAEDGITTTYLDI